MKRDELTQAQLKDVLSYDPDSGHFQWIVAGKNQYQKYGSIAGSLKPNGYIDIKLFGTMYKAHRLAWFYMTGEWPMFIDHINRVKSDNRWRNLRKCNHQQNMNNVGRYRNNKSGFKGVSLHKDTGKWQVQIRSKGGRMHLGIFEDIELAALVAQAAREKYHGEFATQ